MLLYTLKLLTLSLIVLAGKWENKPGKKVQKIPQVWVFHQTNPQVFLTTKQTLTV